jgi:hypothetical protein
MIIITIIVFVKRKSAFLDFFGKKERKRWIGSGARLYWWIELISIPVLPYFELRRNWR